MHLRLKSHDESTLLALACRTDWSAVTNHTAGLGLVYTSVAGDQPWSSADAEAWCSESFKSLHLGEHGRDGSCAWYVHRQHNSICTDSAVQPGIHTNCLEFSHCTVELASRIAVTSCARDGLVRKSFNFV